MKNALPGVENGAWYSCLTDALEGRRARARDACHAHRVMEPRGRGACAPPLAALLGRFGEDCFVEAPFHCSYGVNLHLGDQVYFNAGCVVLDSAPVRVGDRSMIGPGAHIYCADHHRDPVKRGQGIERALPVRIGADVWIGGRAVILPGVTVGDGAIIAAGAVVSRDVAPGARVAGVPARPI
ncbi:Maltose O-acetyltransferase [Candidatus Rhodobacter oscarellae]|uniref:Maltose O-acetyltransferase n=1 Tax=Candidatus Rhodobacter oscarellae TaxID=1675527 RepID=A0A0J9E0H5_9RHOB|nr:sugar O-acetyltransferase [Candidatus Rhodobacter lobularis]KMW56446.1 Maltose O-acetyltransferase [Candidatus Rhodobacter lobularis]